MRFRLVLSILFCVTVALAQQVISLKPGTGTYKAVVRAAKVEFQKSSAFPIKTPGGIVRRVGNWAFVWDRLSFVDPKRIGDGEGIALLQYKGKMWRVVEAEVGSGGMEELTDEWVKKYKLPKRLVQ